MFISGHIRWSDIIGLILLFRYVHRTETVYAKQLRGKKNFKTYILKTLKH